VKAERDRRDYIAKRKKECLDIYKTESDKYNNVISWSYVVPSIWAGLSEKLEKTEEGFSSPPSDVCEITYRGTYGKNFSREF
jgi:hypothetical protein